MCECKRTILIVDNLADTLRLLKENLQDEGYKVFTARNARTALSIVQRELIHLAIVDVRLEHDDWQDDFSGLHLAAALPVEMRKVIITAWRWRNPAKLLRRVLELSEVPRMKYCVFIDGERYTLEEILTTIERAFSEAPLQNMNFKLKLEAGVSWEAMVAQMKLSNGKSNHASTNGHVSRLTPVRMFQHVSCLLFSASNQKPNLVRFLSTTPGHSPCTVAMVRPYFKSGPGLELAAKFGPVDSIKTEYDNFEEYVLPYIPAHSRTHLEYGPVYLQNMGALAYDFMGQNVKSVTTLRDHYSDPAVPDLDLSKTLRRLFSDTCGLWYKQRDRVSNDQPQRLDTLYRSQLNLQKPEQVKKVRDAFHLLLNRPGHPSVFTLLRNGSLEVELKGRVSPATQRLRLPDPVKFCFETRSSKPPRKTQRSRRHQSFFPLVDQFAVTHGDLHSGNVIVNQYGGAWLIDFYKTGVGHALRDFAEMESDIKFSLFSGNPGARYELERALLRPNGLDEPLYLEKPSQQQTRALNAIQTLRQLAFELTDIESTREYYMALLFYALKAIRGFTSGNPSGQSYSPAKTHALLSAALICQRLSSTNADQKGAVFLAHDYEQSYRRLIYSSISPFIRKHEFDVLHPLDDPGGSIWLRVAQMIEDTDAGLYEITTGNGNVYFELGYALGKQKPYFALIHQKNKLERPPLLNGDLLHEYSSERQLKAHVKGILDKRDKWEERFFFLKPAFKAKLARIKEKSRSAVLLVGNTSRQHKDLAPLLKQKLSRIYHRTVDVVPIEQQVNLEKFLLSLRKTQLVVGCLAADRSPNNRNANAELALALGVAKGMGKKTIILQEKDCKVLTDLMSFTITFRGLNGAAEALEAELSNFFPASRRRGRPKY
jgi:nucleoside 2-deoxyribosyltransferase